MSLENEAARSLFISDYEPHFGKINDPSKPIRMSSLKKILTKMEENMEGKGTTDTIKASLIQIVMQYREILAKLGGNDPVDSCREYAYDILYR